jgi:ATP-dependent Clp protease ATP-binding subunit ClpC
MFERFTDRARKVISLAKQKAQKYDHDYVGTEHILLGLIKEKNGVGATALKAFDIDMKQLRKDLDKIDESKPHADETHALARTPEAQKVIEYAIKETRDLHNKFIGTEHLLLGLIETEGCVASKVLTERGITLEAVKQKIKEIPHPIED